MCTFLSNNHSRISKIETVAIFFETDLIASIEKICFQFSFSQLFKILEKLFEIDSILCKPYFINARISGQFYRLSLNGVQVMYEVLLEYISIIHTFYTNLYADKSYNFTNSVSSWRARLRYLICWCELNPKYICHAYLPVLFHHIYYTLIK